MTAAAAAVTAAAAAAAAADATAAEATVTTRQTRWPCAAEFWAIRGTWRGDGRKTYTAGVKRETAAQEGRERATMGRKDMLTKQPKALLVVALSLTLYLVCFSTPTSSDHS